MEPHASVCKRFPDEEILSRVRASGTVASAATMGTYMLGASRALQYVGAKERGLGLCHVLLTPETSFGELQAAVKKGGWSAATLFTTVGSLMAVVKHAGLRFDDRAGGKFARASAVWNRLLKRARKQAAAEPAAAAPRLTWMEVVRKNDELAEAAEKAGADGRRAVRLALLSSIYTDVDPRRQSDYWRLFVVRRDADRARAAREPACVDVTPATLRRTGGLARLRVTEFKTKKSEGPFSAALPKRTTGLLLRSLELEPREYAFVGADGQPFKSALSFTKMHNRHLAAWFGPGVVNRHLRHARATMAHGDPLMSYADRARVAANMAHSVEVSGRVYADGPRPTVRKDGSFDLVAAGAAGRPEEYVCMPKRVWAALRRRPRG